MRGILVTILLAVTLSGLCFVVRHTPDFVKVNSILSHSYISQPGPMEQQRMHLQPGPAGTSTRRTPNSGRKRGTACERCNRRRTKCDGSIIGVPCSACKKSNNHKHCALIQSKRRRYVVDNNSQRHVSDIVMLEGLMDVTHWNLVLNRDQFVAQPIPSTWTRSIPVWLLCLSHMSIKKVCLMGAHQQPNP